jgi:predicted nucleic acid-binding protein
VPRRADRLVVLLDANAVDAIADVPGLAARARALTEQEGTLQLLIASRQALEVGRTPDPDRLAHLRAVRVTEVPTIGVAAALEGALGEPEAIRGEVPFRRHVEDALLAATAAYQGVPLVTADARLAERAREVGVEVWPPAKLRRAIERA